MATRTAARTAIVRAVPVRAAAPIVIRAPSRAPAKKHKKGHRRSSAATGKKVTQQTIIAAGLGGAVLGFIDKNVPSLPTIPMLGRAGTITVIAYFLAGKGQLGAIARDVALAGAAVTGYELGVAGKITGEVMGPVPQVSGRGLGGLAASQV